MARYHNINGVRVQFTASEETARNAEEQAWRDGKFNRKLEALRETRNNLLAKIKRCNYRFRYCRKSRSI